MGVRGTCGEYDYLSFKCEYLIFRELNQRNMELESELEEMRNQQSSLREEKENELQQKYMDHLYVKYGRMYTFGSVTDKYLYYY